ncbi:hypothetical protein HO173_007168 [Letharia columbiana]|uniref:Uncharacterized protein n=1 Tax=Letharia columbiana TaxID=112416 RepID=A0A8H6FTN3_9LECA|nr:uncharacterized protein HO173_007168 [Letharia columbiana]KAF6234543.1 hypothetical protein HO173_007168 [Letharia columbiana]
MSMRGLSPTANLLRTSRLFSLPAPLPRPSSDLTASANHKSDTATLPYPTHAAIETTASSLGRGDWGLKRPLPLKSTTRTSTPTIHIDNVDSIDHITDFSSAAGHALTLRKWQDFGTPLSMAEEKPTKASAQQEHYPRSVFESKHDNTYQDDNDPNKQRWKYSGPWLAGKNEGEFRRYVEKDVKRRRLDFRRFLRERLAEEKATARRREATESGEDVEGPDSVAVSEEDVEVYARRLRNDEHKLHKLVEEYLDLPRDRGSATTSYDKKGPPTTHPSAGLSYLRTGSHTYNHPLLGPQEEPAPVQARVIRPQTTASNAKHDRALIGVGGVVAEDQRQSFTRDSTGITGYNPDIPGGAKIYIRVPTRASVDSRGRLDIITRRPRDKTSENIAKGYYSSEGVAPPPAAVDAAQYRETPTLTRSKLERSRETHGYGLEHMGAARSSGRASPFLGPEDELPDLNGLLRHGRQSNQKV